jgi:hypothetical protein
MIAGIPHCLYLLQVAYTTLALVVPIQLDSMLFVSTLLSGAALSF